MALSSPLVWPAEKPRTLRRKHSQFRTTVDRSLLMLEREVERLGGRALVVTANFTLLRDGRLAAHQKAITDPGVAIYFEYQGLDRAMAVDLWLTLGDNFHALYKTIDAIRGVARWGGAEIVDRAFQGFAALPAAVDMEEDWWSVLGCHPEATRAAVDVSYRMALKRAHPDTGGTDEAFIRVRRAYDYYLSLQPMLT